MENCRRSLMNHIEDCWELPGLEPGHITTKGILARRRKHVFSYKTKVQLVLLVWIFILVIFWITAALYLDVQQNGSQRQVLKVQTYPLDDDSRGLRSGKEISEQRETMSEKSELNVTDGSRSLSDPEVPLIPLTIPSSSVTEAGLKPWTWNAPPPRKLILNMHFWEKLACSRFALGRWLNFTSENFPEYTVVEPSFLANSSELIGYLSPDEGAFPASQFYNLSDWNSIFGSSIYPASAFFSRKSLNDVDLWIELDFSMETRDRIGLEKLRQANYQLSCTADVGTKSRAGGRVWQGALLPHWQRALPNPLKNHVCLHVSIFEDSAAKALLRGLVDEHAIVAFVNFDNRVDTRMSWEDLQQMHWRREWYALAESYSAQMGKRFAAVHFRAGKFNAYGHDERIVPCLRLVLRAALKKMSEQNISNLFLGLDVFGQSEPDHYREQIIRVYAEEMGQRQGYFSGMPIQHGKDLSAPLTSTGKAILDSLIMSNSDLWVGSGARSRYAAAIIRGRDLRKDRRPDDTIQVFCEEDVDWETVRKRLALHESSLE